MYSKTCQECSEVIPSGAPACGYCHADQPKRSQRQESKQAKGERRLANLVLAPMMRARLPRL